MKVFLGLLLNSATMILEEIFSTDKMLFWALGESKSHTPPMVALTVFLVAEAVTS